ncbi:MAG: deoxyuridine 5'-triphosphate nucleotidohydrolase [Tenericutes bacterium 4572_104]|nr:MAG: deoxyuridine 5'-triphosphate nucleotidohydrolase [Tenericutes bacterium 4572_104]
MKKRGFEVVSKFKNENISLPERKTSGSAGYDFSAAVTVTIKPKEVAFVTTGIKAFMPKDEVLQMYPRSSLSFKKKLMKANGVGIIDSDYYNNPDNEGEIMLILYNFGEEDVIIKKGERIAQGIFMKYLTIDKDKNVLKRLGGFGSTGS